jgi:transcriptional regulator with XRE-family HTH domain
MDLRQLFATNLRRLRHQRKLSQEQLAHDAGIDRAYMSRVERAVTYVGLEIIGKLAKILLEVDPAEFFRRPSRTGSRRKAD